MFQKTVNIVVQADGAIQNFLGLSNGGWCKSLVLGWKWYTHHCYPSWL